MINLKRQTEKLITDAFSIPNLYPYQREIIDELLSGHDVVVNRKVGGGKSLCFQAPAVIDDGFVVVVSPLIALMHNQIDELGSLGIRAITINSAQSVEDREKGLGEMMSPDLRIFYISPESLTVPEVLGNLRKRRISLLAVDEAHCVSQWGHDFRPAYLKIADCVNAIGRPTIGAFTATATPRVNEDIQLRLGLKDAKMHQGEITRENLELIVEKHAGEVAKMESLQAHVRQRGTDPTIIYCSTRKDVLKIYDRLRRAGQDCLYYHGGLIRELREENAARFLSGEKSLIVATNAFGMGINKPDIRRIIHFGIPGSIEQYYQELGRAGRDGSQSRGILIYAEDDFEVHQYFIDGANPSSGFVRRVYGFMKSATERNGACARFDVIRQFKKGKNPEFMQAQCLAAITLLAGSGYVQIRGDEYLAQNGNGVDWHNLEGLSASKRAYSQEKLGMMRLLAESDQDRRLLVERYFKQGRI